jgi:hypothetical protein
MCGQEEGAELSCCGGVIMKQIKFRSRTERVLRTTYVVMYAFQSKTELIPRNSGGIRPECATKVFCSVENSVGITWSFVILKKVSH